MFKVLKVYRKHAALPMYLSIYLCIIYLHHKLFFELLGLGLHEGVSHFLLWGG